METNNFKKIIYFLALIVLYVGLTMISNKMSPTCEEQLKKRIFFQEIKGVILKKYIKEMTHGARIIDVRATDSTFSWGLLTQQENEIWKSIQIGDSIFKRSNSYVYFIKSDSLTKEFSVECSQSDYP